MSFACRSYTAVAKLRARTATRTASAAVAAAGAAAAGTACVPCFSKAQVQAPELASHSQRARLRLLRIAPCTRASWGPSPSCSTTPSVMAESPAPSAVVALLRAYKPALATVEEAAAFAVHATLLAAGFELLAVGEAAERLERPSDAASIGSLDGWNNTPGVFSFLYSIPQQQEKQAASAPAAAAAAASSPSPLLFVKCLVVAETLMVDACCVRAAAGGAGDNDAQPLAHVELRISDVVRQPSSSPSTDVAATSTATDYNALFSDLARIVTTVSNGIAKRILAEASQSATPSASFQREHQQQQQQRQEREQGGARREAGRASTTGGLGVYPAPLPGVGAGRGPGGIVYPQIGMVPTFDDINPGGSAGLMPSRGGVGGGSMLVGPDDPRWGQVGPGTGVGVPRFGGGGIGDDDDLLDPTRPQPRHLPPGVPPGARFDPFGPPGDPGFEPGQFGDGGTRRRPGGGPGQGPGGIHSDLQFFNPPF